MDQELSLKVLLMLTFHHIKKVKIFVSGNFVSFQFKKVAIVSK